MTARVLVVWVGLAGLAALAACSGTHPGDEVVSAQQDAVNSALVDDDMDDLDDRDDVEDDEIEVALDDVPQAVLDAADAALPGFVPLEAEIDRESGRDVYDLEGTVDGETWEVEVLPDGTVLEVERDD